jgi:hypothetical protein
MVTVVASGFIGRFLMRQIPRDIKGHTLEVQDLKKMREGLRLQLAEKGQIDQATLEAIEHTASGAGSSAREPITFIISLVINNAVSRYRIGRLVKRISGNGGSPSLHAGTLNRIAYEEALLNRRILLLKKSQGFFKNWHRVHKPFTHVLLAILLIHVLVSVYLGYRWIF